ncbi:MAG: hypothetical protein PVH88_01910 [Ignavibacteria bacterium]|jgi:hypothetical protein
MQREKPSNQQKKDEQLVSKGLSQQPQKHLCLMVIPYPFVFPLYKRRGKGVNDD